MKVLNGKTGVVTGAASGIGRALVLRMLEEGMRVVAADVDEAGIEELARESSDVAAVACDVTDPSSCSRLAEAAWERFDGVHVLCNNAGVLGRFAPVWDQDPDDWRWLFSVNVMGVANVLRAFVPRLLAQDAPAHIVNTASEAAFSTRAFVGVYHASKHAVLAISETLAQELGEVGEVGEEGAPIRVSVLCPGGVNTRVLDAARNRPGELAPERESTGAAGALRSRYGRQLPDAMAPEDVASAVLDGIRNDRFYIFSHPEVAGLAAERAEAVANDAYPTLPPRLAAALRRDVSGSSSG